MTTHPVSVRFSTEGAPRVVDDINRVGQSGARLTQLERAADSGSGGLKRLGQTAQQAGYQVGDFAVQVASGQSALVAFTQQGAQMLGIFGTWGAIAGAAVAITGALAIAFLRAGDSSETATNLIKGLEAQTSALESGMNGLKAVAEAYATAIGDTAGAQAAATNSIIADTQREFAAKKTLLDLEIQRQRATQAERNVRMSEFRGKLTEKPILRDTRGLTGNRLEAAEALNASRIESYQERTAPIRDALRQLEAEATLANIAIERALEVSNTPWEELARGKGGGGATRPPKARPNNIDMDLEIADRLNREAMAEFYGGEGGAPAGRPFELGVGDPRRGGGGRRGGAARDGFGSALAAAAAKTTDLEQQIAYFGRAAEEMEAWRLETDLLNEALEKNGKITKADRATIDVVVTDYKTAALALREMNDEQREQERQARESKQTMEELGRSVSSFVGQVAASEKPLKTMLGYLLQIAAQGITGTGPFGAVANSLLGVASGGLFGALTGQFESAAPLTSPVPTPRPNALGNAFLAGRIVPFAAGGVVTRPTVFPMAGGDVGIMGEEDPEAIMPLKRGRGGRLGVSAEGMGAVTINVDARGATDPAAVEAAARRGAAMALAQVPAINRDMQRRGILR